MDNHILHTELRDFQTTGKSDDLRESIKKIASNFLATINLKQALPEDAMGEFLGFVNTRTLEMCKEYIPERYVEDNSTPFRYVHNIVKRVATHGIEKFKWKPPTKVLFLSNRQKSKSHLAVYEFLKDPENTLFVSPRKDGPPIYSMVPMNKRNNGDLNHLGGNRRLVVDDYFDLKPKTQQQLHGFMRFENIEVFAFGTPPMTFEPCLLTELVTKMRRNRGTAAEVIREYRSLEHTVCDDAYLESHIIELQNNMITDPQVKVIIMSNVAWANTYGD